MTADTIVALSSGQGRAGVAVIRVSGAATRSCLASLAGDLPEPRSATLRRLRDAAGDVLDQALVLWFPEGRSFTGEDLAEFHCHGGRAVIAAVLDALLAIPGCRLAEPGEFTLRAFQAGRMNLSEVEALGDLLSAETEAQRQQAQRMLNGAMRQRWDMWSSKLLRALALLEVTIDWADEDVPVDVRPEVSDLIGAVLSDVQREIERSDGAEKLRSGFEVALLGGPNAGKSSFINTLSGREAAITSPVAGTTRDVVELRYDLMGLPVVFLDMAGLRNADDPVEREGIRRAVDRGRGAALRLLISAHDAAFPAEYAELFQPGDILVRTKHDEAEAPDQDVVSVSNVSGEGVSVVLERVFNELNGRVEPGGLIGHKRQLDAVSRARDSLSAADSGLSSGLMELVSADLRQAVSALHEVVGEIGTEDVLGEVFRSFCLGK